MKHLLLAATLALTTALSAQTPKASPVAAATTLANPAMWKVKGVHGTVYLFGTVHVMRKDIVWETPKVKAALNSSDTLYLEIADIGEDAMKAMQPVILKMGLDMEHPLSTKISMDDVAALDTIVHDAGMPGESAIEPMRPWLVTITLSLLPLQKSGYDPALGIDQVLSAQAKTQNKPVKGFETAEQQLHVLADFPESDQVIMLHEAIVDLPKAGPQMEDVITSWTKGDVEKIASIDNDELKVKHPDLYQKILVKRNEGFADQLAALLKDPATGTVFAGIGAGHLAGPDSVLKMLEKKGYTVSREE